MRHGALVGLEAVERHERRIDDVEQHADHHVLRGGAERRVVRVRPERRDGALQLRRRQLRHKCEQQVGQSAQCLRPAPSEYAQYTVQVLCCELN